MLSTSGFDFTGRDFHEVFKTYEFKDMDLDLPDFFLTFSHRKKVV